MPYRRLTPAQVDRIRWLYEQIMAHDSGIDLDRSYALQAIARRCRVSRSSVHRIIRGQTWPMKKVDVPA